MSTAVEGLAISASVLALTIRGIEMLAHMGQLEAAASIIEARIRELMPASAAAPDRVTGMRLQRAIARACARHRDLAPEAIIEALTEAVVFECALAVDDGASRSQAAEAAANILLLADALFGRPGGHMNINVFDHDPAT